MQFTTPIPITKSNLPIDYTSRVLSLGSCFAVNMEQKLDYFKFRNSTNPFGILFHPVALENFIGFAANAKTFTEDDIFFHNERWHCFDAHSDLSHTDKDVLLTRLTSAVVDTCESLKKASHIIITLGTAWVYRRIESNALVANCHKVPQKEFIKELLSVATIQQSLQNIISLIHTVNPTVQILFTVSPVRHIKDGFIQNQWSKANLISALQETLNAGPKLNSFYFPSYEIMMDELRDYRFYSEDMIHPNQTAIDYIWKRFTEACISPETTETMKIADSIQKGLQHRSFNPQSQQHLAFVAKLQEKIAVLQKQHPHITF